MKRWYQEVGKEREGIARVQIKTEVLTHYGKGYLACVICGESRLACLSIDHINGGGRYQTLCMNCQFLKSVLDRAKYKET